MRRRKIGCADEPPPPSGRHEGFGAGVSPRLGEPGGWTFKWAHPLQVHALLNRFLFGLLKSTNTVQAGMRICPHTSGVCSDGLHPAEDSQDEPEEAAECNVDFCMPCGGQRKVLRSCSPFQPQGVRGYFFHIETAKKRHASPVALHHPQNFELRRAIPLFFFQDRIVPCGSSWAFHPAQEGIMSAIGLVLRGG